MKKAPEHKEKYMRSEAKITKEIFSGNWVPNIFESDYKEIPKKDRHTNIVPVYYDNREKVGEGKRLKTVTREYELRYSVLMNKYCEKFDDLHLSALDRRVHDIICNLYEEGYRNITIMDIFKYLYPLKNYNQRFIVEIYESVQHLTLTWVRLDITEEAKAYGYNLKSYVEESYLIPAKFYHWNELGDDFKTTLCHYPNAPKIIIELISEPPLLTITKANRHMQSIPRALFLKRDYKKIPRNKFTEELIEKLLDYVSQSNRYNRSAIIYNHLADELNLNWYKRKELRNRVKLIIDWFKENHVVKTYTEYDANQQEINDQNNNPPRKIVIIPPPKEKVAEQNPKYKNIKNPYSR